MRKIGVGAAAVLSLHPFSSLFANINADYIQQLELIGEIKDYCKNNLELQLGNHFYTDWEMNDGYLHYLYVSEPNAVHVPDGVQEFYYFGTNGKSAHQAAENFKLKGYHTLVYLTAGTSATLLNRALMSYEMDAIAVIVFHEALHVHLRELNRNIPLSIEEAAADVLAKYVSKDFQRQTNKVKRRSLRRTIKTMERIYKTVNSSCNQLESSNIDQTIVFNKCYDQIKRNLRKANKYQQKRFSYPVNNAYFVRNSYYSRYYFDLEKLYKRLGKSPVDFIHFIAELPNDEADALQMIQARDVVSS